MKKLAFLAVLVSACAFAAPQFVTPAMMKRNGLTDEQYEMLWNQGKHPQIDIATARDWVFRASRYTNVVEWLEVMGTSNDFARLSHKLQGDCFALAETNKAVVAENADLWRANNTLEAWYSSATNQAAQWQAAATDAQARLERVSGALDERRAEYVQKRDAAALPTTKALYQAFIDAIDRLKEQLGG